MGRSQCNKKHLKLLGILNSLGIPTQQEDPKPIGDPNKKPLNPLGIPIQEDPKPMGIPTQQEDPNPFFFFPTPFSHFSFLVMVPWFPNISPDFELEAAQQGQIQVTNPKSPS